MHNNTNSCSRRKDPLLSPWRAETMADFSTLSMFGINSLQASPNLIGNFVPPHKSGVINARQKRVGGGDQNTRDFSNMRKRSRDEEGAAAAAAEEEEMVPSASVHSNILTDHNHQQVLSAPNITPTGAGISPSHSLLYLPDYLDSDLSLRIQRDLLELDLFISAQMEMVRAEMEQKRRRQWACMARAVEDALQRAVRAKDEQIASVARRNSALEERVGALAVEGQMWRALARTNEAAAVALRRDILLAQQAVAGRGEGGERWDAGGGGGGEVGDSVSCCEGRQEEEEREGEWGSRRCRVCRRVEVSTLVLPCRHLCLCGECDQATAACPLCGSLKSASIKVHLL